MNMLGNLNHVFFLWVKKMSTHVHRTCVEYFFRIFFLKKAKKNHACLKTLKTYMEFFDKICKIGESPHKSYEHTWVFSNSQIGLKSSIRAFSVVMKNTLLTTETKRYTLRTVNRRWPLRVDSTLSAGPFICWHMTVKQSTKELLCLWKYKRNSYWKYFAKSPIRVKSSQIFQHSSLVHYWNMKHRSTYTNLKTTMRCA